MAFDLTRTNYTLIPPFSYWVWRDFLCLVFIRKKEKNQKKERIEISLYILYIILRVFNKYYYIFLKDAITT